ncbi:MAG: sugar phosphate nucleotidyltransferase [Endomicrobiia bacterium]|nr:sugar phosphate nucleotidyltransferase [Endomicrobiia bacterium]
MQAIILAGGKGSRLRPYTTVIPKPLMPVGNVPVLEIIIRSLKKCGFGDIVISTGYLAGLIRAYFGDGGKWGVKIRYVNETKPLNTAGALNLVGKTDANFLVMNGDILADLDFGAFLMRHEKSGAAASVCVTKRKAVIEYGIVEPDENWLLASYSEKPSRNFFVSTGIYALKRGAVSHIARGEALGMPDLLLRLKKKGLRVACVPHKGFWLDIGRHEDYQKATELADSKKLNK